MKSLDFIIIFVYTMYMLNFFTPIGGMMADTWNLRDARNSLPDVIKSALSGIPQRIAPHGKAAVVVIAEDDYLRLSAVDGGIVSFFRNSPLGEAVRADDITFERLDGELREVGL